MASSSQNMQNSSVRGGASAVRTPANTTYDADKKGTVGMFSSEKQVLRHSHLLSLHC